MNIQPITVTQNDFGYEIPFTLEDGNGDAQNLTGASLSLLLQDSQDPDQELVTLGGTFAIDSALDGTCHYVPIVSDFPTPGIFLAQVQASYSGTQVITWPVFQIIVVPALPQGNN
jgi:hypothetical protein